MRVVWISRLLLLQMRHPTHFLIVQMSIETILISPFSLFKRDNSNITRMLLQSHLLGCLQHRYPEAIMEMPRLL